VEKVGKEEKFNNPEDDEELNDDYLPQGAPYGHFAEAVPVKAHEAVKLKADGM